MATSLDYILVAYLAVYFIASLLSIDKVSSFLGYHGRFTGSFVSILTLIVLYFLVVNNVRDQKIAKRITDILIFGGGLAMVYGLLQLLGIYILPLPLAQARSFNTIGSMVSLSVFSGLILILLQWAYLTQPLSRYKKIAYAALSLIGFIVMFLINAFVGWVVLAIGLVFLLALGLALSNNASPAWFWKPMVLLVVAILFVAFNFLPASLNPRRTLSVNLPVEIQLSSRASFDMVKNSVSAKPLLGYGPGTTGIAFGEIKPENLNKSVVWSLNFDRASSEIASIAIETGLIGLLVFEAAAILFFIYGLYFLLQKTDHPGRNYAFAFFLLWVTLYALHFLYFFNTTFYFLYWFSLAMFMTVTHWHQVRAENGDLSFSKSPRSALSWMFVSLIALAAILIATFFQTAVYLAETAYASGIKELNKPQPDFAAVQSQFESAIKRNQYRDTYFLAYGQTLIFRAAQEAAKEKPDVAQFQTWIADLIQAGRIATDISPAKSSNWSARAQFYSQLRSLAIPGSDKAVISSWEEAVKRDGNNPSLYVQLAQAYANASETIDPNIVGSGVDSDGDGLSDERETEFGANPRSSDSNDNGVADADEVKAGFNPAGAGRLTSAQLQKYMKVDEAMLKKAEDALKKSIELKDNLPDSYIALARLYERWQKLDQAKAQLDTARAKFPNDSNVLYELGRITFNQRNLPEAEKIFISVIRAVPNHANAHYSLGLVYLQQANSLSGEQQTALRNKALVEFEKTREITGPNVDLEKVINSLKIQLSK